MRTRHFLPCKAYKDSRSSHNKDKMNIMKDYFLLQYKMINRKLKEAGINPVIGYSLGLTGFILISEYVFQNTDFAKYLVLLASFSFLFKLSEKNRADFLLTTFGDSKTKRIRVAENLMISLPFITVLIFKNAFLESALLLALAIILATFSFRTNFNITIPTPFFRYPFEFTVGFRKSFYIFPVAYGLTVIAINVDNLNLGIFAMLLVFLISLSYYTKPENEYYVWVHAETPKNFILNKLKLALRNIFILSFPILLGLLIFYPEEFNVILLFYFLGVVFLWTIILAKYSAYPQEMNLPEGILIALGIFFPPLLIALIPFFYSKSVKKLKVFLND